MRSIKNVERIIGNKWSSNNFLPNFKCNWGNKRAYYNLSKLKKIIFFGYIKKNEYIFHLEHFWMENNFSEQYRTKKNY